MVRLDRIYTKVGDKGSTLLATGEKVSKSDLRIEAYGTVDELNAHLGCLAVSCNGSSGGAALREIQQELFDIGAELSSPGFDLPVVVNKASIRRLECEMDEFNKNLPSLTSFVLPGAPAESAAAHVCRTVCRRAERSVVRLAEQGGGVRSELQVFLNRLSDWLFVYSRVLVAEKGEDETLWVKERARKWDDSRTED